MRKSIFPVLLVFFSSFLSSATIQVSPGQVFVGATVHFSLQTGGESLSDIRWDFGDGTVQTGASSAIDHVFRAPGNYHLVCSWEGGGTTDLSITVQDNRSINILTPNPAVYQEIDFSAESFSSSQIQWDFGDGTVTQGGNQMKHSYSSPGSLRIKVNEVGSNSPPVEKAIAIGPDIRRIELSPPGIVDVGTTVSIRLANSNAAAVDWMIGTDRMNGAPPTVSHQFLDPGSIDIVCTVTGQPPVSSRIVINDQRALQVSPQELFDGSQVAFEAARFASPSVRWDFGDGTMENGGTRMNHRFPGAGSYVVKVYDFNGQSLVPVEKRIQVLNENRDIVLKNQFIYVNSEIELEASNFRDSSIRWDFGDGMALGGGRTIKHRFNHPGSFSVRAVDFGGQDGKTLEKKIMVEIDTRDIVAPVEWIEGEAGDIALKNVSPGNYVWKFSNGESRNGNAATGVRFSSAGPFQVIISDPSGKYPPLEKSLLVKPDVRVLKSSVPYALPVDEVTFTTLGFRGPSVKWDFGDETVKADGRMVETHTFGRAGIFKVTAIDFAGKSTKIFSQNIQIAEILPDFDITTLELAFDNGKYYRVIPKNSAPPGYQLRINAKGRGILKGNLQLDDQSLGLFQIILYENQTGALERGQIVPLPVLDQGLHRFTVKFSNFSFSKAIPVIKYFISLGGAILIRSPLPDSKVARVPQIMLQWETKKKNASFEIAVSGIPFQFLTDSQIEWKPVEKSGEYRLDLSGFKIGDWVYWQVREVDGAGQATNTSEIAAFKIVGES